MERKTVTFPVRVICLCCIYALNIAVLIAGFITGKLWLWTICLVISVGLFVHFRTTRERILSDYLYKKRMIRTRNK